MKPLATSLGFDYLGSDLPNCLVLPETPFDSMTTVWNVISGERHGIRVIVFDCRFGRGKASWCRTIIAHENNEGAPKFSSFDLDLQIEHSGGWTVMWRPEKLALFPTGLMPVAEIKAYLEAF
jgi:hypothetical protein